MNEVVFVQDEKRGSDFVFGEEKDASLRGAECRSSWIFWLLGVPVEVERTASRK